MPHGQYTYAYPRPMVTVDAAVFTLCEGQVRVLLIERGHEPFKGMWALPGGFLDMDEELDAAAARELAEETGITGVPLVQVGAFGGVHRDPRGRVITVTFAGFCAYTTPRAGDDAAAVAWHRPDALPALAADHNVMVPQSLRALQRVLNDENNPYPLPDGISRQEILSAIATCIAKLNAAMA